MSKTEPSVFPRARTQNLVVRKLDDEILVYDRDRYKANCLNTFAGEVWERCDGQTSAAGIADALSAATAEKIDERTIWRALDKLSRAHLLEEPVALPPPVLQGTSRRQFFRRIGIGAAAAIPAVTTILVPHMAEAQSCVPLGGACISTAECCPVAGVQCCGTCSTNC